MLPRVLSFTPQQLAAIVAFDFDPGLAAPSDPEVGRLEMWEPPVPGDLYVVGSDFAKGLVGRDFDAAIVLNASCNPVRQVFEAHGHWGPELYDKVLYCILRFYDAFLCGERQEGLTVMRRLLSDFGYAWMYYDRREESRSRRLTDKLGYWKPTGDVTLPNLRRAVRSDEIIIRSRLTRDQMDRLQYKPKTTVEPSEAQDKHMEIALAGGGSPDLVIAAALAWHATGEVAHFDKPAAPKIIPGSNADILGHDELFFDPDPHQLPRSGRREQRREARRRGREASDGE